MKMALHCIFSKLIAASTIEQITQDGSIHLTILYVKTKCYFCSFYDFDNFVGQESRSIKLVKQTGAQHNGLAFAVQLYQLVSWAYFDNVSNPIFETKLSKSVTLSVIIQVKLEYLRPMMGMLDKKIRKRKTWPQVVCRRQAEGQARPLAWHGPRLIYFPTQAIFFGYN